MIILYANVGDLTEEIRRNGRDLLTEERYERLQKYRMEADKKRCFGAGLLLRYGLEQCGARPEQIRLRRTEEGKPYLEGDPKLHFNLSHAKDFVAAVFDTEEVGIDIESKDRYNLNVAKRFFCEEEQQFLEDGKDEEERAERFSFLWTRKESYIKAIGLGMRQDLRSFCVLDSVGEWGFTTFSIESEYHLSVCAGKKAAVCEPVQIDLKKVLKGE